MAPPPRVVTIVLVDDGGGTAGALPVFDVEVPWWQEAGPVVDAVRARHGLDISIVRLLDATTFPGGPVTYLAELTNGGLDGIEVTPWSGSLPGDQRRPDYAEVGGLSRLLGWADTALADRGIERVGPAEQVRTWNLSCLVRLESTIGELWLKAVPALFAHEAAVVAAIADVDATLVPDVVANRPGAMMMRRAGERDGYDLGPDRFLAGVERFARAAGSLDLEALPSVPRFTTRDMVVALENLADRHGTELDTDQRRRLATLIGEVPDRWRAAGERTALVHGDLHGGNLRLAHHPAGDVIIDWGDTFVSHPLFDLASLDSYTPEWPEAALDRWLAAAGAEREDWVAFRPVATVRLAVLYRRFCDRIETSELPYHEPDILPALRTGLAALQ